MKKRELLDRIRSLTSPLAPQPFGHSTKLTMLTGIKCVAFDFYGTMFISGVGDIFVDEELSSPYAKYFEDALQQSGFSIQKASVSIGAAGLDCFKQMLKIRINRKKAEGITHPEPDILAVWEDVLAQLSEEGFIKGALKKDHIIRFAIEFEFRANRLWPVPDLAAILQKLRQQGLMLGIISNSQFYTPLAFEALLGQSPPDAGFEPELLKWSYHEGVKKPSVELYRQFRKELPGRNLSPEEVLYVGNDLFKDIIPALKIGFKTALYVGDQRSVRHDKEDLKAAPQPDLIIDKLSQIIDCLQL